MNFILPQLTPVAKALLLTNVAIFILQISGLDDPFRRLFAVLPTLGGALQVWRLVTYQFLHGGFFHIFFNMLVLYFLAPVLERQWGSKKFLIFYLACGVSGGLLYILLAMLKVITGGALVGASGAILGGIAASAVMYPNMTVMLFFIIPMRIRTAAMLAIGIFVVSIVFHTQNAGGNAAHLGGMLAGGLYTLTVVGKLHFHKPSPTGLWHEHIKTDRELEMEVDRILTKVNKQGLSSLSRKEKKILQEATRREQERKIF